MKSKVCWMVSSVGLASVALSMLLVFTSNVSASCYVENSCGVACNGTRSCSSNATSVTCDGRVNKCPRQQPLP